jgi:hypothetical protein
MNVFKNVNFFLFFLVFSCKQKKNTIQYNTIQGNKKKTKNKQNLKFLCLRMSILHCFDVFVNLHYSYEHKFSIIHYYIRNVTFQSMNLYCPENHLGVLIINVPTLIDAYRNAIRCFFETLVIEFPIFLSNTTNVQFFMEFPPCAEIEHQILQGIFLPVNAMVVHLEKSSPYFALKESYLYYMLSKIYQANNKHLKFLHEKRKDGNENDKIKENNENNETCLTNSNADSERLDGEKIKMTKSKRRRLQRIRARQRARERASEKTARERASEKTARERAGERAREQGASEQAREQKEEKEEMEQVSEKGQAIYEKKEISPKNNKNHFLHKYNDIYNQLYLIKDFTNHCYLYKINSNSIF